MVRYYLLGISYKVESTGEPALVRLILLFPPPNALHLTASKPSSFGIWNKEELALENLVQ